MSTRIRPAIVVAAACAALCAGQAFATPSHERYGYAPSQYVEESQVDPGGLMLQAGEFAWLPGESPRAGSPVTLLVNLRDQRGYLYQDGRRIAVTTVSTGRPGYDTPTGVFPITEKRKVHHSNRYNNAPMPFMQRLTRWGHALHAGDVRPTPASHGCIRLPAAFAKELFSLTRSGDFVVIAEDDSERALARAGVGNGIAPMLGASGPLLERVADTVFGRSAGPQVASEATGALGVTAY